MVDKEYDRSDISFEQAMGVVPLPRQLELEEISPELRAQLFAVIYQSIRPDLYNNVSGDWSTVLRDMHVKRYHRMLDEYNPRYSFHIKEIKQIFASQNHIGILGFLEWVMRQPQPPYDFWRRIDETLKSCRAAYRVVNKDTIVPISSVEEKETLDRAFYDLASTEYNGARQHLKLAADRATEGKWADSIRESMHAVESTAKSIVPDVKELGPALAKLEEGGGLHSALKKGFGSLYGFTSDEKGIRHALLEKDAASVDQTDALFMLGACAAFVSYLINKAKV